MNLKIMNLKHKLNQKSHYMLSRERILLVEETTDSGFETLKKDKTQSFITKTRSLQ